MRGTSYRGWAMSMSTGYIPQPPKPRYIPYFPYIARCPFNPFIAKVLACHGSPDILFDYENLLWRQGVVRATRGTISTPDNDPKQNIRLANRPALECMSEIGQDKASLMTLP